MALADLDRLKANLLTSGLQNKDSALYQVINQLIDATKQLQANIITQIITISSGSGFNGIQSFLTINAEGGLPNSRKLVAGSNITFDLTVPGQLIINSAGSGVIDHVVLSDGALPIPEPVDDGFGNFVYVEYTP